MVTSTLRTLTATAAMALLLSLAACSSATDSETAEPSASASASASASSGQDCSGVTVVVDASAFEDADDISQTRCIETDKAIAATDALDAAGVTTEGTTEYGDQVVCRVDGLPAEDVALTAEDGSDYFETCESMPAAFAYWSLWVQPAGGEWAYATEGLSTLQLQPGEGVALLFTLNGAPATPTS